MRVLARSLLVMMLGVAALTGTDAEACNDAYQSRLLPLGVSDSRIIALELEQYRGGDEAAKWDIGAALVAIDAAGHRTRLARLGTTTMADRDYEVKVRRTFARALRRARALRHFQSARLVTHINCDHGLDCGGFALSPKGDDVELSFEDGGASRAVDVAGSTLAFGPFDAPEEQRLGSVRMFEAAGRRWAVVGVSAGEGADDPCLHAADYDGCLEVTGPRGPRTLVEGEPISASFYEEFVLHHGHDVDVFIPLADRS